MVYRKDGKKSNSFIDLYECYVALLQCSMTDAVYFVFPFCGYF